MIIREEFFTMSDGIRLYTRMVLPEEGKKFPIVFMRQPYEEKRGGEPYPIEAYQDDLFLKNGYAVILQHTRGRGDSEGVCKPYQERQDGLDTLEIIRTLPFYNGEIYLVGRSYLSTAHLCYLDTNPPDIKAASLSIQTDRMYLRNYRNGCCYDYCNIKWWMRMLKNRYPDQLPCEEALYRPYYKIAERIFGEDVPEYTELLLHDTYHDFWQKQVQNNVSEQLQIPVLLTEGWYDFYLDGMFSMWERLPEETRKQSVYVVGPWGHATEVSKTAEYPLANGNIPKDWIVKFFNSIRDGVAYQEFETGRVNYYTIGGDFWTTDKKGTRETKLYFQNHYKLSENADVSGTKSFVYNPEKKPGSFRYHDIFKAEPAGSIDGVLSFESEAFSEDTEFYGKIRWHMKVKSDCDDTAFFMRVYFVENGASYNLTETITTLLQCDENYTAGSECLIDITTPMIGFRIKKGNAIRVDISSHSDMYVPHANVVGHWAKVTETKTAVNTVICDEDSYIVLPVCTE
ncbi:MAG: CocE/NonD family hydrolase [Ruminococcaceae bacterium]|nr:CocE/NonD family hydrolase [Oscillospiraceae bacterium]